jgi:hypothetical protein
MTDLETAARAALEAMQAVVSGDYPNPRDHRPGQCSHGRYYYEDCLSCVDEWLAPHIAALEAVLAVKGTIKVGSNSDDPAAIRRKAFEDAVAAAGACASPQALAEGDWTIEGEAMAETIIDAIIALADKEPTDAE